MTTPDSLAALGPDANHADEAPETALISRLFRELYAGSRTSLPADPSPAALNPSRHADAGLGGIYPSGTSPDVAPVHPDVPARPPAERPATRPAPESGPPTGAAPGPSSPASPAAYPFGEPRCDRTRPLASDPAAAPGADTAEPARGGIPYTGEPAAPEFYFLREAVASGSAASAGHGPVDPGTFFDVQSVRRDFPALHQSVNGRPLVWLDNAATTHKPRSVIDATSAFYARDNSNIHRAAHTLAARSTELYEGGREKVRQFLGAGSAREIVFVRGTTEAINLVAQTYGRKFIGPGEEILLTTMEHHANIVPWQLLAEQTGAIIRVAPINDAGELILDQFVTLLGPRTRLVAVTHVANALGTINPIEQIIAISHAYGVPVLVDAAQSTPHLPVNVQALDVDFLAFSGHKVFGPTGIGALYAKSHWLEQLPPWQGGGNMIRDVTFARTTYQDYPQKFEAGTQDIAGVVGLGAAIDYLLGLGLPAIAAYEHSLLEYATAALGEIRGLRLVGTAAAKASVLSFVLPGFAPEDIAKHLDRHGIAVRSGHHCAQPALRRFGLESTVRPSLAFYNTRGDVDALVRALHLLRRS